MCISLGSECSGGNGKSFFRVCPKRTWIEGSTSSPMSAFSNLLSQRANGLSEKPRALGLGFIAAILCDYSVGPFCFCRHVYFSLNQGAAGLHCLRSIPPFFTVALLGPAD